MPTFKWQVVETGPDGPASRSRHGLIHDPVERATILFGGIVWGERQQVLADTWSLKDGHWTPVDVSQSPPARHRGAMAFDEARGISVLVGGLGAGNFLLGDTWTFARPTLATSEALVGATPGAALRPCHGL